VIIRATRYLCAFLVVCLPAVAQEMTGSINGAVMDVSGKSISGVQVSIVNNGTNLSISAQTDKNGSYQTSNLQIGDYTVSFSKDDFDKEEHKAIVVQANRTTTVNASLKVGTVSTTVEVSGTPLLNETDTSIHTFSTRRRLKTHHWRREALPSWLC